MIKLIHLSLFITSSLIHFIIHINNIHLLKWHLVVRFIVRDAINFCMFEWNFVSQSNLEDTVYVYLTLWNRTGAITGSNLVDLGVLRRAKSHQHPKNTVINSQNPTISKQNPIFYRCECNNKTKLRFQRLVKRQIGKWVLYIQCISRFQDFKNRIL